MFLDDNDCLQISINKIYEPFMFDFNIVKVK